MTSNNNLINPSSIAKVRLPIVTTGRKSPVYISMHPSGARDPMIPIHGPNICRVAGSCYTFARYAVKNNLAFGGLSIAYSSNFVSEPITWDREAKEKISTISSAVQDLSFSHKNTNHIDRNINVNPDVINNNLPKSPPSPNNFNPSSTLKTYQVMNQPKPTNRKTETILSEVNENNVSQTPVSKNTSLKSTTSPHTIPTNPLQFPINVNLPDVNHRPQNQQISDSNKNILSSSMSVCNSNRTSSTTNNATLVKNDFNQKSQRINVSAGMSLVLFPNSTNINPKEILKAARNKTQDVILQLPQIKHEDTQCKATKSENSENIMDKKIETKPTKSKLPFMQVNLYYNSFT